MSKNRIEKIELTNRDADWLENNFPLLRAYPHPLYEYNMIKGTLQFIAIYLNKDDVFRRYKYEESSRPTGEMLSCSYRVEVHLITNNYHLPPVREIEGRIAKFALSNNIPLANMHISRDKSACLSGPIHAIQYMKSGFKLDSFIEQFVVPYFYDQAYFEKFKKWPRGELDHNVNGEIQNILEFCPNLRKIIGDKFDLEQFYEYLNYKNIKLKHLCICGSGKPFHDCHPDFILYSKSKEYLDFKKLLCDT